MSWQAVRFAMAQNIKPAGRKMVYVALAFHADATKGQCFPGQQMLARETGQTDRAVRSHLNELQRIGYIRRERRHRVADGSRSSDRYSLAWFPEWVESGDKEPWPLVVGGKSQLEDSSGGLSEESSSTTEANRKISQANRQNFPPLPEEPSGDITIREPISNEPQDIPLAGAGRFAPAGLFDLWLEWFGTDRDTLTKEHGGSLVWCELNAAHEMVRAGCDSVAELEQYFQYAQSSGTGGYFTLYPSSFYVAWVKQGRPAPHGLTVTDITSEEMADEWCSAFALNGVLNDDQEISELRAARELIALGCDTLEEFRLFLGYIVSATEPGYYQLMVDWVDLYPNWCGSGRPATQKSA